MLDNSKLLLICQLIALQIPQYLCQSVAQIQPHIVNGRPTDISNAPYLVQIFVDKEFWCSGTLTGNRFVVTGAHCVYDIHSSRIIVKGGATTISESGIQSRVNRVMVPRTYNPDTEDMDVAVLKLARPLIGSLIRPIALCTRGWRHNSPVQVFGWGTTRETALTNPNSLRTVNLRVVGWFRCNDIYNTLTNSMFCASSSGKASCYGDSGGPVLVNGQFCGIISWSTGCARRGYPDVYTNILLDKVNRFIRYSMRS